VTTVTDTYYGADLTPLSGLVQYRAAADRPATGGGHVAPAAETALITNGVLSLSLDPGPVYIRVVLTTATYPEYLYQIPTTGPVVLSSLAPIPAVTPTPTTTIDGGTL
jgi:hypothetical protein